MFSGPLKLNDYAQTVYKSSESYFDSLSADDLDADDLDKEVDLSAAGMGKMGLGTFLLTMLLGNNYAHTGEISALRGVMGNKGHGLSPSLRSIDSANFSGVGQFP